MSARSAVALVLHAHLPYVLPSDDSAPIEMAERWLYEALWACYLPLIELLDGLCRDDVAARLTLSVSPTLADMLAAPGTKRRFVRYLDELAQLNADHRSQRDAQHAIEATGEAIARARRHYERIDGDVMGALQAHARACRIELMTSAVSHAYLPALSPLKGAAETQLRLGRLLFARWAEPDGMWLPECGFDDTVDRALAACGARHALVAAHAAPVPTRSRAGVRYLPRHRDASLRVWASDDGYPAAPCYREFHRDAGLGLKYWRIGDGAAYQPTPAARQAAADAADYRRYLEGLAGELIAPAFDAELFGHWWYEGPLFLEALLRQMASSDALEATTLAACCAQARGTPSSSSWGAGGHAGVWLGPRTAPLVRHVHRAHADVVDLAKRRRDAVGLAGRYLDQAIRELLLLQASDWAFMIDAGPCADYGRARFDQHLAACRRFVALADGRARQAAADRQALRRGERGFAGAIGSADLRGALIDTCEAALRGVSYDAWAAS